jgi:hypothetical protein
MTDPAQQRQAALRQARESRGPADSYTDRSLYDRCITRGLVGSLTPAIYNAGNEIVQAPGYVVIRNEMIHEARVVPLDGSAHPAAEIKQWLGDSRGHWEGDTLVVECRRPNQVPRRCSQPLANHAPSWDLAARPARRTALPSSPRSSASRRINRASLPPAR